MNSNNTKNHSALKNISSQSLTDRSSVDFKRKPLLCGGGGGSIPKTTPPSSSYRKKKVVNNNLDQCDNNSKKEAIAIKYPKRITDILMNWMIQNKEDPFPNQQAVYDLMRLTGLDQSQIVNWTTNVRKRNMKATCEGLKKPHHFIDFLFLAQDRDNRTRQQNKNDTFYNQTISASPSTITTPRTDDIESRKMYATNNKGSSNNNMRQSYPSRSVVGSVPYWTEQYPTTSHQPIIAASATHLSMPRPRLSTMYGDDGNRGFHHHYNNNNMEPMDIGQTLELPILIDFSDKWLLNRSSSNAANRSTMIHPMTDIDSSNNHRMMMQQDASSIGSDLTFDKDDCIENLDLVTDMNDIFHANDSQIDRTDCDVDDLDMLDEINIPDAADDASFALDHDDIIIGNDEDMEEWATNELGIDPLSP